MPARGCGDSRVQGGLYMVVPMSPNGKPIEFFLVDPVIPWNGGQLRAPELFSLPGEDLKHVAIGVGASFYPWVPDFAEEVRVLGLSKRVPLGIDLTGLVPGESRLLIEHPKAIPKFNYSIPAFGQRFNRETKDNPGCPKKNPEAHLCIGDLWPLCADPFFSNEKHQVKVIGTDGTIEITTPSVKYSVHLNGGGVEYELAMDGSLPYQAGIILKFPYFQFEYVSKAGKVPRKIAEKFEYSQFDLSVVPE